jgi:hypothetical protein
MSETREIDTLLDNWLANIPKITCYTQTMKVYAPTCRGECMNEVDQLAHEIVSIFGGCTIYDGEGCWKPERGGEPICEPVKIIEIGHNCSSDVTLEKLARAVKDYASKTKQESLSIKNGHFFIAETPRFTEKYRELAESLPTQGI